MASSACAFSAYDSTGGQNVDSSGAVVNLDTTLLDEPSGDSPFALSSSDELTVNTPGTFLFLIRTTLEWTVGAAADEVIQTNLQTDTGGGFAAVADSRCFAWPGNQGQAGAATAHAASVRAVSSGDKFRVHAVMSGATNTAQTVANGSGLSVARLGPSEGRVWSVNFAAMSMIASGASPETVMAVLEYGQATWAEDETTGDPMADAKTILTNVRDNAVAVCEEREALYRAIAAITNYEAL